MQALAGFIANQMGWTLVVASLRAQLAQCLPPLPEPPCGQASDPECSAWEGPQAVGGGQPLAPAAA